LKPFLLFLGFELCGWFFVELYWVKTSPNRKIGKFDDWKIGRLEKGWYVFNAFIARFFYWVTPWRWAGHPPAKHEKKRVQAHCFIPHSAHQP